MRLADIIEPEVMTYPDALLTNWAFRAISLVAKGNVPAAGAWFIKPAGGVKLFDGYVRGTTLDNEVEEAHRQEQEAEFSKLSERSEERRAGKEGGSTCRSRWSPEH